MCLKPKKKQVSAIWVSDNTMEQMPMWCPPTPPQQDTDIYMDQTVSFLYDTNVMSESQLPPIYVKKDAKRTRHEAGFVESRRPSKVPRKEDSMNAPKSLFHSATILKMKRDLKLQKYRGIMRSTLPIPVNPNAQKPTVELNLWHEWTIHEDMAILKVIQSFQGLPLNLVATSPGHTANWDFVADYVNTVSITYRSPKQCRHRYETVLIQREEGRQVVDNSVRKKKSKSGSVQKFSFQPKSSRPLRTSQLYTQDNNATFAQILIARHDSLKSISTKRPSIQRTVANNPLLKNPKHTAMLTECGIDLDHPVLPVEVAARRAERLAREKKPLSAEQQQQLAARLQLMKGGLPQAAAQAQSGASTSSAPQVVVATSVPNTVATVTVQQPQVTVAQTVTIVSSGGSVVVSSAQPATPPNAMRSQRIISSPLQGSAVVSGLSQAQLQAATQRLIVSAGSPGQGKEGTAITGIQTKSITPAQLHLLRQQANLKQQLRLQAAGQGVKTSTVTIGGQATVVQFTQAQPRTQFVRQANVTVGGKTGNTRTVTENEVNQLLKKQQQQLQQQKTINAAGVGQATQIQGIPSQVFAQAVQQGGSGTQQVALVKAVSTAGGVTQTVTIPVSSVTLSAGKTVTPTLKGTTPQQIRTLFQKKLGPQKLNIGQVGGKNVQTQLIVGSKPISTGMTVQQFTQVMTRTPLGLSRGPVVLTKGPPRVIPVNTVNTSPGGKQTQTIQVVAATSQAINSALRPQQGSANLASALAGIKVQGQTTQAQQALLSQVSAALQTQSVAVRQGSPVRLQTPSGASIVAVTVQPSGNVQQQQTQAAQQAASSSSTSSEQVSRFIKKQN